jgi:cytochrome c-type biogenesis protein CcmH/NrfG
MKSRVFSKRTGIHRSVASYFMLAVLLPSASAWPRDTVLPASGKASAATFKRDSMLCSTQGNVDACYDAIRWSPNDPALLVGLGDALVRAKHPQDAIRNYRRAAVLAPDMRGLAAKISAAELKMVPKRASVKPRAERASGSAITNKRYSNVELEAQSH